MQKEGAMEIQRITGPDVVVTSMQPTSVVRSDKPEREPDNSVNREAGNADHENKGSHVDSYA
jgi:hypothetical protein